MRNLALKSVIVSLSVWAFALTSRADSLTNNFDTPFNYLANGIIGDTFWDGVYLTAGDLPNNTGTGGTVANTLLADTAAIGPYLEVRTTGTDWAGANDDGFFLYKVVSGDFDVSVQSAPSWQPVGNHFAGILVRAWHTNLAGSPYSTTVTNFSENFVEMMRGQEFDVSEVRISTNGGDFERAFTDLGADDGSGSGTNATRYYRIVRSQETNFMFFWRTNNTQDWTQRTSPSLFTNGVYIRPDLAGVPMQIGINHAMFANSQATAYFTDFELSGPNVKATPTTLPPAPSGIVTTATNITGSLTFSWTKGDPGDNSLVIVKANGLVGVNPIQGVAYNANPGFATVNTLMGSRQYVVYNGSGNSVTVTNLKANNIQYTVAVYEYTNTGSTLIYNTAVPATNNFVGPGIITAVALTPLTSTNIPVGGAAAFQLLATFSTGESNVDQTASTGWSSSDPTIADVSALGIVSGISNGTAQITATFGAFIRSAPVTVHAPVFTDNFTAVQDYVASGLVGSVYDGLYLNFGDVPGTVNAGGDGPGSTFNLDSQITTTNGLFLSSVQSTWEGSANDGPFLFKNVPGTNNAVSGDFQVSVHIANMNILNGVFAGLMARLYNPVNHARGPNDREYHVNYWKVQNGTTSVRQTVSGANTTILGTGPSGADTWLLMQRFNSTNFFFYERTDTNAPWVLATRTVLAAASNNAPMEVGIAGQSTLGVNQVTTFDSFMLDAAGITTAVTPPPPATNVSLTLNGDLSVTLNWVAESGGVPIPSIAVMRSNAPVSAQPIYGENVTGNSVFGAGTDLGGRNYVVYVSPLSPPSTNNSVTVTGLTVGRTYYAAVYTYANVGGTNVFNSVVQSGGFGNQLVGFLTGFNTITPTAGIPKGGLAILKVIAHYQGGVDIDSTAAATFSTGDTNVLKTFRNIATGITNGTATLTTVFGGFTSNQTVTVRPPTFVDNFDVSHNYVLNGVAGTPWDGMFNPMEATNPIPASPYVPLTLSGTTVADANITSNKMLTITAAGDGWENANAGGFFLFKYVPGDFQTAIHISSFQVAGFNQPGLLARAYAVSTNNELGAPLGLAVPNANGTNDLGEYWVSLCRFDEFNIGTYARRNLDSGVSQNTQTDPGDTNFWLLIIRSGQTTFDFFKRLNETDPWRRVPNNTSYTLNQFNNRPMQVGIMGGPWTGGGGTTRTVSFEKFMLDATTGTGLRIGIAPAGGNAMLSWSPAPNQILQSRPDLQPGTPWTDVPGTPTLGTNGYSLSVPIGPTEQYFRLRAVVDP